MMVPSQVLQLFLSLHLSEMLSQPPVRGKDFFDECCVSVFPRGPVKLVVVLTGHTAREPVVMHPGLYDHECQISSVAGDGMADGAHLGMGPA